MIKIKLAILFLCFLLTAGLQAQTNQNTQTGKIIGVVVSHDNGSVIRGVKVIVASKNFNREVLTDDDGRYEMEVPLGIYNITTEVNSFKKFKRKKLQIVYPGTFIQNISLKSGKAIKLDDKALKEMGF